MKHLQREDPVLAGLIDAEAARIDNTLNLIASESLTPPSIREALGSVFTTKAAEGYPGRRFHAGCDIADEMERLAVQRGKALFGADHINVQPHSGSSANLAVYFSVLAPGDRVLAMKLSHGGHLTHGADASITSRCFNFSHYGVRPETGRIDYDAVADLAGSFRPRMIVAGASSYSRAIDHAALADIAARVGAFFMVDMAHIAGLVAAGVMPSPVPHADFVTFTTYKTLMGGRGGVILCKNEHARAVDSAVFPGSQGTPELNQLAAKAFCFHMAAQPEFTSLQQHIVHNARHMAAAFVARGFQVVSGGTDNHLAVIDLRSTGIDGRTAEQRLADVGILVNRNVIPFDPLPPNRTSGIRIGTTTVTARGMRQREVEQIAGWMAAAMNPACTDRQMAEIKPGVADLCERFPAGTRPLPGAA